MLLLLTPLNDSRFFYYIFILLCHCVSLSLNFSTKTWHLFWNYTDSSVGSYEFVSLKNIYSIYIFFVLVHFRWRLAWHIWLHQVVLALSKMAALSDREKSRDGTAIQYLIARKQRLENQTKCCDIFKEPPLWSVLVEEDAVLLLAYRERT